MTQNYIGQVTTKAILKYEDGYVIVRQEESKKWILPGGRLDFGESPEDCMSREIKEELGIDCKIEGIIGHDAYQGKEGKLPKLFIFYSVSLAGGQIIKINNEIVEFSVISKKEDLDKYQMFTNQREVLEKYLD